MGGTYPNFNIKFWLGKVPSLQTVGLVLWILSNTVFVNLILVFIVRLAVLLPNISIALP